jgi:acyl carrier protein
MANDEVSQRLTKTLSTYLTAMGQPLKTPLASSTKLMQDAGLSSDDGVMLVLDICQEFGISLPDDFSATVHDDGRRDRTFGELTALVGAFVNSKERVG